MMGVWLFGCITGAFAQTTFTESASSFGLNLGKKKDGGHAWADFDGDGLIDVLVLENNNGNGVKSFLMRQSPAGTFTNVQSTLAPGMLGDAAERQAVWGDLNNDGRPDFMINSHGSYGSGGAIQIFVQNADGTFGDGAGGTSPITVGRSGATININSLNSEGTGFFDFEGDGDLDIFFDNHNFGIEILRNNYIDHTTHTLVNPGPGSLFTHITPGNGNGVTEYGLNQYATDGDYGTAADVNDDGWVDIFMRKRDENDFFLNQGGMFTNGADLGQAANNNKGGNGLWDLDNDGDLDAVWTENGLTQIYRNDGAGVWMALGSGVFPGLPQPGNTSSGTSSASIDALAGGDIDNDGDIDLLLVGDNRSYLFINELNSPTPAPGVVGSGAPMTFSLDPETFNSGRDGEGTTMVDIDDDGDLDIYMNINNSSNQLYINNLPTANRKNHLIINVTEDRSADGTTGAFPGRVAIGTNVIIKDCAGNIVSGLRQVNGVYGHGTQQPELVHFGLPLGENETYIIEVRYPNFVHPTNGVTRLIATTVAQPSTISGTNHYSMTTTDAETIENPNPPVANDDLEVVSYGNTVSVQIDLFANDSEPDGENFFIESIVQPAIGSVTIDDADNGLVTYTYSGGSPFTGTTFDYTITDATSTICPAQGKSDTAKVTVYEPCADPAGIDTDGDGINDVCDLDDDNDGILDRDEGCGNLVVNPSFENQDFSDPTTFPNGFSDASGTFIGASFNSNLLEGWTYTTNLDGWVGGESPSWSSDIYADAYHGNQYIDIIGNNSHSGGVNNTLSQIINTEVGKTYTFSFYWGEDVGHGAGATVSLDVDVIDTSNNHLIDETLTATAVGPVSGVRGPKQWYYFEQNFIATSAQTTILFYATPSGTANGADIDLVSVSPTMGCRDTDNDGLPDAFDLDSDGDGCFDALEGADSLDFSDLNGDGSISGSVDDKGVPIAVSGGQGKGSSADNTVTSDLCDDDGDGVNNANDKCPYFDDAIDSDNDGIPDGCDVDDDNDGVSDCDESIESVSNEFAWTLNTPSGNLEMDTDYTPEVNDWILDGTNTMMLNSTIFNVSGGNLRIETMSAANKEEAVANGDYVEVSFTTGPEVSSFQLNQIRSGWFRPNQGDSYYTATAYTKVGSNVWTTLSKDVLHTDDGSTYATFQHLGTGPLYLDANTEYSFRFYAYGQINDSPQTYSILDDIAFGFTACRSGDLDGDTKLNHLDEDSDDDGCYDANEAYADSNADSNNNGMYGSGVPAVNPDGTVSIATYPTPADGDGNSTFDFLEYGNPALIIDQPLNITICPGCTGAMGVTGSDLDTFQWQIFDNGNWTDLGDGGIYSGTTTDSLIITDPTTLNTGKEYRVVVSNSAYVCSKDISTTGILTIATKTVITNRRITYRVKKN
ncbi:VCBS repeat-containing protein [Maribacter sp. ANRC-HE7]|uniref:VCBS repeat-containing protein n=1 Tax=Maribacter aquimaris TaxID=2737171 RepID=A0ABR7V749_9FLAO|nr:FG-GAP-like repeat-containing protein [Maribacter aquimaris]MBD0779764.1 VCBS repeat-containing protein [Maribacter aquimaris]